MPPGGYWISKGGELEMSPTQLDFGSRSEMVKIKKPLRVFSCILTVYLCNPKHIPTTQHRIWRLYSRLSDFCLRDIRQPLLHLFLVI